MVIQQLALEMLAFSTAQPIQQLEPLRIPVFCRPSPVVAGTAVIIDDAGRMLLMRPVDNHLWIMPRGRMEVEEAPAAAVVREALEETGVECEPVALVGVYDSRLRDTADAQHIYIFTFLYKPLDEGRVDHPPFHMVETVEIGWFAEEALPVDLYTGHHKRIRDAFHVWRGEYQVHFDGIADHGSSETLR